MVRFMIVAYDNEIILEFFRNHRKKLSTRKSHDNKLSYL